MGIGPALFLVPSDRMGGAERIVRTLALEAARSGIYDHVYVQVLCLSRTGTFDALEASGKVSLQYTGASGELGGLWPTALSLMRRRWALVFSSSTHLNALASLLRRLGLLRVKLLVARETTMIFERDFGRRGWLIRSLYRLYGSQDLIICQTDRMRHSLNEHTQGRFCSQVRTVTNPVDFDAIAAGLRAPLPEAIAAIPPDRIKIAWCGRLQPIKSPARAIECLHALHVMGHTRMHLVMIGEGPLLETLVQQVRELALAEYVTFTGFQGLPSAVLARCELGLLTSDHEGFPNVVLEMLASGLRWVVCTDCAGGLDEVPSVSVVPVTSNVVEDLAAAICAVQSVDRDPRTDTHLARRTAAAFLESMHEQAAQ